MFNETPVPVRRFGSLRSPPFFAIIPFVQKTQNVQQAKSKHYIKFPGVPLMLKCCRGGARWWPIWKTSMNIICNRGLERKTQPIHIAQIRVKHSSACNMDGTYASTGITTC